MTWPGRWGPAPTDPGTRVAQPVVPVAELPDLVTRYVTVVPLQKWKDAGVTGYDVRRVDAAGAPYPVTGLSADTPYAFVVTAKVVWRLPRGQAASVSATTCSAVRSD
ncbi:hypothetical protein FHU28_002423 [Micromonospora echinospora]|uniref:Fibronectin type-III domain-containing protein n=1 Tax=Micromonospora echinospora TaxID=1877 RepID=A0ABR6MB26_MICEC|nr:hypothetical protein [Micromonospora echinospora]MBB5112584.1 hypothetical protein [Micromonospora echinospora]